ncbi:MAG: iron ABC transporter permease [Ignavibacteria bacterium]|nr:iron ABC transporter permease [Ignavibacteria bacterium]
MSKKVLILSALTISLLIMFLYALTLGSADIPVSGIFKLFSEGNESSKDIILNIRLPRILNSMIVGASLSCSGMILQSMLRNSLAEPGLLGISAGAGLGAILTFILPVSFSFLLITPVSFIFAILTTLMIFFFAKGFRKKNSNFISSNKIILAGIAVSAFISSINGLLLLLSGSSVMQIIYWLNGGLSGRGWNEFNLGIFFAAAGVAGAFLISKDLNVLNLSEELAVSLGLDLKKFQKICIILSSVLAATAVSIAGIISFVGLIVPNLSKLLIGNDHRYSVPCTVILGALFLLTADTVSRMVIAPSEIPVGIVTSLIGAPVFIWLIFRKNKT